MLPKYLKLTNFINYFFNRTSVISNYWKNKLRFQSAIAEINSFIVGFDRN